MRISDWSSDVCSSDLINTTPLVDVMLVLLIIFLIAVPVAIQTIEKLRIPVIVAVESKDKVENLLLTVSTTDDAGRSAGEPGYQGASRNGECRIYLNRSEEHTSELQSLMRISYAVFCLKKKKQKM